jgi:O-acetyl-ADP-ribose deacetylase (regulator of RNase III)
MSTVLISERVRLTIAQGDIATQGVDAVVNAANSGLWMGSGVAGALKRAGGADIERDAMRQGPIEPGEAVITTAGTLAAKHVIHAAAMGEDLHTNAELIRRATEATLDLAEREGLTSIAFPALGTGVGGFAPAECARVMLGVFQSRAAGLRSVTEITIVLFGEAARTAFEHVAQEMFDRGGKR